MFVIDLRGLLKVQVNNLILEYMKYEYGAGVSKLVRRRQLVRNLIFSNAQEIPTAQVGGETNFFKKYIFSVCKSECLHRAAPSRQANKRTHFSNGSRLIYFDKRNFWKGII